MACFCASAHDLVVTGAGVHVVRRPQHFWMHQIAVNAVVAEEHRYHRLGQPDVNAGGRGHRRRRRRHRLAQAAVSALS